MGPLRLNLNARLFPLFSSGGSTQSNEAGQTHYAPPRGLQLGLSYEHEVRVWKFDGANSLGLLTDLAALRVVGSRMLGPVQLSASLGALYEWHGQFVTGEAAAHVGLYLPGFRAMKLYAEALGRGFPAYVKPDAMLASPDGQNPIHPQGVLGLGLSYHPHVRVDLGVSVHRGFGGLAPWAVTVQFLGLSIGKTYQGRAATPVLQTAADVAHEAAVEIKEFLDKLPIDPQLDEECQILDKDGITVLGHFGNKTKSGYYCEQDGFLVPIRQELLRDKNNTKLCRDDAMKDCLLERHGPQWVPVHRPRLDGACRMTDSDGTVLGTVGEPTADGKRCRFKGERLNGRYGSYTEYQDLSIGALFHTDADRTAVCVDEAMRRCFLKPPAGRHTLAWGDGARASTALVGGLGDGFIEQGQDAKAKVTGALHAAKDVAAGKVKLNTIYGEARQEAAGLFSGAAALIRDPAKRAAAIQAAHGRVDQLEEEIEAFRKQPPEVQLEGVLGAAGRVGSQVVTGVVVSGGAGALAKGAGLANTALKGVEAEATVVKTAQQGKKVAGALEPHTTPKALPPAPQPRGLLPGPPPPVKPPEPGRFIVDRKGNVLIEPKGGFTQGNTQGTFVKTHYPNSSPAYQLHEAHPKRGVPDPHGHHRAPGQGPAERDWGPSLGPDGQIVPYNSPDAHWTVKK